MTDGKEKNFVFDNVERNREAIALLCDLQTKVKAKPNGMPTKIMPLKECVQIV